ncbi:MAG: hypothetical protein GJ676_11570 [Rhodobacteraceae bacterium]|nr:hypothetical protein [Paracoccaceae bacterium]
MLVRKVWATVMATSLVLFPIERAQANDAAALIGGMILGGVIVNEANKNRSRKSSTRSSGVSSSQRAENRQVQEALNYFGYNVGTVDGSLGRKSRAGIARFQADMGYTSDGYLDPFERDFLLTSHQRAQASMHVAPYNQILASQGPNGVLRTYRNEQLGIAIPQQVQPLGQMASAPTPVPAPVAPSVSSNGGMMAATQVTPVTTAPVTQPQTMTARNETATLPTFNFGQTPKTVSGHCNEVNVLTATNGGYTRADRIGDPEFALDEQFCQAATHAQADTVRIEATIANTSPEQVQRQCTGLTQAIKTQMDGLATSDPYQVNRQVLAVLQSSGLPMDQLISGGKVCLGVGYRTEDAEMALASALLLTAGGQLGYAEVISHQLRHGLGAPESHLAAKGWMEMTLNAANSGAAPVLGQTPERLAVLRAAQLGGSSQPTAATLPVFPTNN